MAILCLCHDVPDSDALREAHRDAHFAYIETIMDRLHIAGPVEPSPGEGWRGSAFIYATDDPAQALELLHNDPYWRAGIYDRVDTLPFLPAAGHWIGGGIWQSEESES